MSNRKVQNIY